MGFVGVFGAFVFGGGGFFFGFGLDVIVYLD